MQVFSGSRLPAGHLLNRLRRVIWFLAVGAAIACVTQVPARAQYGLPPSPAFETGQRLQKEAEAARSYADSLQKAGNAAEAARQRAIARSRAFQAIHPFEIVTQSATYRRTAVGAEAMLYMARLQDSFLDDPDTAANTYKQLLDNYSNVSYPDQAQAVAEAKATDQAVDFKHRTTQVEIVKWFFPIPFPSAFMYRVMNFLVALTGHTSQSYWLAIVMISVFVKLLTLGLSAKQFKSLKETQKLQPYLKELQAKYKNDRETLGRKTMELYQEHGINPMAGCAPLLIQLPVMFLLYNTIRFYQFQFQHGTFLWIGSPLSKMYPNIFAADLGQADIPLLGLYMLSMYVQMRMTTPADPQQAEQQRMMAVWMPFMTGWFFLQGHWPSAFILYYLVFNVLSMLQQQWYMKWSKEARGLTDSGGVGTEVVSMPPRVKDDVPQAEKNGSGSRNGSNGAKPAAKGAIAPKVHPKKKRR